MSRADAAGVLSALFGPLEHLFQGLAENMGNAECDLQRWGIFALFNRGDCLPRDPHPIAQIGLGHFTRQKAQRANVVGERQPGHNQ